jgi:hypothetical protein
MSYLFFRRDDDAVKAEKGSEFYKQIAVKN